LNNFRDTLDFRCYVYHFIPFNSLQWPDKNQSDVEEKEKSKEDTYLLTQIIYCFLRTMNLNNYQ